MTTYNKKTGGNNRKKRFVFKRANKYFKLVAVDVKSKLPSIPLRYRCNPYEICSSGDPYWADKRNVDRLKLSLAEDTSTAITLTPELQRELLGL